MKLILSLITATDSQKKKMLVRKKQMSCHLLQEHQKGQVYIPVIYLGVWKENPWYFPQNLFHIIQ